jgi:hypothetical protein
MSSIGTTPKVCFIGGARYDFPLNTTDEKKFARLSCLGELFVIGFSKDLLPHAFASGARFYLLPLLPVALLRYVELLCCGTLITLWLVLRHRVRVLIAQSPYEGVGATLAKRVAGSMGRPIVLPRVRFVTPTCSEQFQSPQGNNWNVGCPEKQFINSPLGQILTVFSKRAPNPRRAIPT